MSKKATKFLFAGFISTIVCFLIYVFVGIIKNSHSPDWQAYKQYTYFFKDSVKNYIDTNFCCSFVKKTDVYNNFNYKQIFNIIIWEFKNTVSLVPENVKINQNINLNDEKFNPGEILNKNSDLEIAIKSDFSFNNAMNLNLDFQSKIEKEFNSNKYKGLYGLINKVSLSNEYNEHQILFNYTMSKKYAMIIFYKGHTSFFIIIIDCERPFDENIINILNLE